MDNDIAVHHPHASETIMTRISQQVIHQHTVCGKQVALTFGVPVVQICITVDGIKGFLNVTQRRDNAFTLDYSRDLLLAQGVTFNSQRPLNSANAVDTPQPQ